MRVHEHQMAPITSDCDAMRVHEHLMAVITSDCDRPTRTRAGLGRVMCEAAAEQRERRAFSLSETTPFFHEAAAQRGNAGFLCSLKQGLSSLKLIATTSFERQQHSKERRGCLALEKQRLPSMRQEHTKGSRAVLCSQTLAFVANPSFHEAGAQSRKARGCSRSETSPFFPRRGADEAGGAEEQEEAAGKRQQHVKERRGSCALNGASRCPSAIDEGGGCGGCGGRGGGGRGGPAAPGGRGGGLGGGQHAGGKGARGEGGQAAGGHTQPCRTQPCVTHTHSRVTQPCHTHRNTLHPHPAWRLVVIHATAAVLRLCHGCIHGP